MRLAMISALYPPKMLGGAENSARNLAEWLVRQGVHVSVIRATDQNEPEGDEVNPAGVHVWRVKTTHPYAPFTFPQQPGWKKPLYHLQDHFDARISGRVGRILDQIRPDLVNVHMIQGIGYPVLAELARRNLPVNYVLPDLGLACIRMNMFKNGRDCASHCTACRISRDWKLRLIRKLPRLVFTSPSQSNIDTLSRFFPVKDYPNRAILNPNAYPAPSLPRSESAGLRLLYAGRIHSSKGVDMLLEAVASLAERHPISLTIAGSGQQEAELRQRGQDAPWCRFLGFVSQQALADQMMESDLLCIPSIWAENSPGVVIQALGLGLPVLGSNRGGIPELVKDGVNGRLVGGQSARAWADALSAVLADRASLEHWRENALSATGGFSQDGLGREVLAWMRQAAGLSQPG
ncbi:glycosyltransferase family 4 protein [Xinfangfangia sp. D13-10-4-6]|uniref:glycosyltransferase family 4 protein n=1 Tax=Pseudogemmobacter hezensis TaxID=2737662 RepID=UPI001551A216|nr:glycosyltransferase family 4 protein [Pseudogemmobacter hezensis]NPD16316.1 glycosyltransferase family 4 protein [Pseudogemmobacter hezensis]